MAEAFPGTTWVHNQRFVIDGQVMTTTGISASLPASLALVEAIAGRHAAELTAQRLGLSTWKIDHDTSAFTLTADRIFLAAGNWLAVWRHEVVEMPVDGGFDEISVALMADAWSRTFRSEALATNVSGVVRSRHGLLMETEAGSESGRYVLPVYAGTPARALDAAIEGINGPLCPYEKCSLELPFEYIQRSTENGRTYSVGIERAIPTLCCRSTF